jgi:uncharacterized protein GlcG (DUF336 family)
MNYALSSTLVSNAVTAAQESGVAAAIVVVDRAGKVVSSARMDGSNHLALAIAHRKASTAAILGVPSQQFADMLRDDPLVVAAMSSEAEIILLGGGIPVVVDGSVIGGIGISGSDQQADTAIAQKALEVS